MDCYVNGLSMEIIDVNWSHVKEALAKLGIVVPQRIIDGVCNYKEGAAELLLGQLYSYFTGHEIGRVEPAHPVDFTDHAYQVSCMHFTF